METTDIKVLPLSLKIFKGDTFIKSVSFAQESILIGRVLSSDLQVDDDKASRLHASIDIVNETTVYIFDLGSSNGTLVNGERITEKQLVNGDTIQIGHITMVVAISKTPVSIGAKEEVIPITDFSADKKEEELTIPTHITYKDKKKAGKEEKEEEGYQTPVSTFPLGKTKKGMEITMLWDDAILDIKHFEKPGNIYIGTSPKNHFYFLKENIPDKFCLISYINGQYFLNITESLGCELMIQNKMIKPNELGKLPNVDIKEVKGETLYIIPLPLDSKSMVSIGDISFFVQFVSPLRQYKINYIKKLDKFFVIILFLSALFHIILLHYPVSESKEMNLDAIFKKPNRFTKLIILPKKAILQATPEQTVLTETKGKTKEKKKAGKPVSTAKKGKSRLVGVSKAIKEIGKDDIFKDIFGTSGLGKGIESALKTIGKKGPKTGAIEGKANVYIPDLGKSGDAKEANIDDAIFNKDVSRKLAYGKKYGKMKAKGQSAVNIKEEDIVLLGSLNRNEVHAVIAKNEFQIKYCIDTQLLRNPNLQGKIKISWIIRANGRVADVRVVSSTVGNKALENCLVRRIKRWIFPKPKGGGEVEVNFPFIFGAV